MENKEQFFAQYYNQSVYYNNRINLVQRMNHNCLSIGRPEDYLLLKEVSNIEDNHLKEIGEILDFFPLEGVKNIQDLKDQLMYILEWQVSLECQLKITDYLRSKGYALPFRGLTIDQQIEKGWIKLKDES